MPCSVYYILLQESSFYVVARLSSLARVVVIGMGALGAGVTGIAGVGQLLLAVQAPSMIMGLREWRT